MPWRTALKVALAAGEAVAKALTRAVRDEIKREFFADKPIENCRKLSKVVESCPKLSQVVENYSKNIN